MTTNKPIKPEPEDKLSRDLEIKAAEAITKAKQALIVNSSPEAVLYSTILLSLETVMDYSVRTGANREIPTVGTDGRRLLYHPQAILNWSFPEIVGALAHEAGHIIFRTLWRKNARDMMLWNWASDYVINGMLDTQGFKLPSNPSPLLDHKYDNHTSDEIYDQLKDEQEKHQANCPVCQAIKKALQKQGQGGGKGQGKGGQQPSQGGPGSGCNHGTCVVIEPDSSAGGLTEEEAEVLINQAVQAAKSQGTLPAGMERWIEKAGECRNDYRKFLQPFLRSATSKDDITWLQPSRRGRALGLYIPGKEIISSGVIGVVIDTSGSMGNEELGEGAAQISGISMQLKLERLIVVYSDAEVDEEKGVQSFRRDQLPFTFDKFKPVGGGGTDFRPAIKYLEKQKVDAIVYFTDGYGTYPESCSKPILWIFTVAEGNPPFGMKTFLPKVATR